MPLQGAIKHCSMFSGYNQSFDNTVLIPNFKHFVLEMLSSKFLSANK